MSLTKAQRAELKNKYDGMSHSVAKIINYDFHDSGDDDPQDSDPGWHYVDHSIGDPAIFCSGMFFGSDGKGLIVERKTVKRGGITCADCLKKLRAYKAVRL